MDAAAFLRDLDRRGRELGTRFGDQPLMANSREALEAGEFAKEHGNYHAFHDAVFKAYFTDGLNIGDRSVLLEIAADTGLDPKALGEALNAKAYLPRLEQTTRSAREAGVTAAPTFFIEGYGKIIGAQQESVFRSAIRTALDGGSARLSERELKL